MKRPMLVALLMLALPAISAAEPVCQPSRQHASEAVLDDLFSRLKRESNPRAAERLASRIGQAWLKSGSATVDLLIARSQEAVRQERYAAALDLLDRAIALEPGYAEGWNRRATLHFMMNRYDKSLADIACTLHLEPRHFGALAGMGTIYRNSGMKANALKTYLKVLEVYPANRNAQKAVGDLTEEMADNAI